MNFRDREATETMRLYKEVVTPIGSTLAPIDENGEIDLQRIRIVVLQIAQMRALGSMLDELLGYKSSALTVKYQPNGPRPFEPQAPVVEPHSHPHPVPRKPTRKKAAAKKRRR